MKVNLYLHNLKLTPTDTVLFESANKQKAFFEGDRVNSLALENIAYNGSRRIKITIKTPQANLDGYNYAEMVLEDGKVMYSFIDEFIYVNDSTAYINLTLDYIQTYMFDIEIAKYKIEQRTMPRNVYKFNTFPKSKLYSYSNSIATANKQYKKIVQITQSTYETDGSLKNSFLYIVFSLSQNDEIKNCVWNDSYDSGIVSVVFPCILRVINGVPSLKILDIKSGTNNILDKDISFEKFITKYNALILNFSICDTISTDFVYNSDNGFIIREEDANTQDWAGYKEELTILKNFNNEFLYMNEIKETTIYIPGTWQFSLLCREPYARFEIGRKGDEIQILSTLENTKKLLRTTEIANNTFFGLELKCIFNPIYPNELRIKVVDANNFNIMYSIPARQTNMTFDKTKWEEYFIQHSVIINDGLATKHSYDIENATNNLISSGVSSTLNMGLGVANVAMGNIGGAGNIVGGANNLIGSVTSYVNAKNNIEKEKALLELEWKNIKSKPASIYNFQTNQNAYALMENDLCIYLSYPVEEDLVYKYHERYGYKISVYLDEKDTNYNKIDGYKYMLSVPKDTKLKYGQKFDFVRYSDIEITSTNIPKSANNIIKQILEQGITYWYDYNNMFSYEDNYSHTDTATYELGNNIGMDITGKISECFLSVGRAING